VAAGRQPNLQITQHTGERISVYVGVHLHALTTCENDLDRPWPALEPIAALVASAMVPSPSRPEQSGRRFPMKIDSSLTARRQLMSSEREMLYRRAVV
jgi:hypothetical protein